MVETLSVKNGFLTMVYGGGSTKLPSCKKSLGAHIQFVCDNVPEGQGEPAYDGFDDETCIFHFTWVTKAACPVRGLAASSAGNRNCTAVHPATMKSIDLRKLFKSEGYTLKDHSGTIYKLTVCGDLTNVKG